MSYVACRQNFLSQKFENQIFIMCIVKFVFQIMKSALSKNKPIIGPAVPEMSLYDCGGNIILKGHLANITSFPQLLSKKVGILYQ